MDVERTIEFLLAQQAKFAEQQAKHEERQTKFENDLLQINSVLLDVAASQERTNGIVGVLAERLIELSALVREHIAGHN